MSKYLITFLLPGIANSPKFSVTVEAPDEDAAMDLGFDEAFRLHPEFGAFEADAIMGPVE